MQCLYYNLKIFVIANYFESIGEMSFVRILFFFDGLLIYLPPSFDNLTQNTLTKPHICTYRTHSSIICLANYLIVTVDLLLSLRQLM